MNLKNVLSKHFQSSFKTVFFQTQRKENHTERERKEKKRKSEEKTPTNHKARVFHIPSRSSNPLTKKSHSVSNLTFFVRKTIMFAISQEFPSLFSPDQLHIFLSLRLSTQFAVAHFVVETRELSAIKL
jgi:hypothetical protein